MGGYFFAAIAHSPSHFRPPENDSLLIYAVLSDHILGEKYTCQGEKTG